MTTVKNCELLVRKKLVAFIEKILNFYKLDFGHERIKSIFYVEKAVETELEQQAKRYYDAFLYLLHNSKNRITQRILNCFYYILYSKEMDNNKAVKLVSFYFRLKDKNVFTQALLYHIEIYKELDELNEVDRTLIPLMFYNYVLVANDIPTIRLFEKEVGSYIQYREDFVSNGNDKIASFFTDIFSKTEFQDKSYYKNLTPLTKETIFYTVLQKEEELKREYKIKEFYLFGSFAKGTERIDSDIDFIICFSNDLSFENRNKFIEQLKKKFFLEFQRFIDIHEIDDYLGELFLNQITEYQKIF